MDKPAIHAGYMGLGTTLLRRACHNFTEGDTFLADVWKGDPYQKVYFRIEGTPSPLGPDPIIQVMYSNTTRIFDELDAVATVGPSATLYALQGLIALSALQPTGKILGRRASTPWIIRCFPIIYLADALAVLVSWMHLVFVSGQSRRQAASAVFKARNPGEKMEHWTIALAKAKAAMPTRWISFLLVVGIPLAVTFKSDASAQAKSLLSVHVMAWLVFEALLLAAKIDADEEKTDMREPTTLNPCVSDSPVLLQSPVPLKTVSAGEKEEIPAELAIPVALKSDPNTTPKTPKDEHPSTSATTRDTRDSSPIMHYFSTTVIIVSTIFHVAPFLFPEATEWYGYLAGWYLSQPVDRPSLYHFARTAVPPYFWISLAAQDIRLGEWLSALGNGRSTQTILLMMWPVLLELVWGVVGAVFKILGMGAEATGLRIAVAGVGFLALRWVSGGKENLTVGVVNCFRFFVIMLAGQFYTKGAEDLTWAVTTSWVCQQGGLCYTK